MKPLVSIVIPVYNGRDYLQQAIDSALNQTYDNIEIIVVDDGSNDGGETKRIISSYGNKIRPFFKDNGGVGSALNYAISEMKGEYFSWLSHDDLYLPQKIENNMKCLESMPTNAIVYSGFELVNAKCDHIKNVSIVDYYSEENLTSSYFTLFMGLINGCTLLIPRYLFETVGCFDEKLKTTQDYDLWFKMFRNCSLVFDPSICVQSRMHENQGSRTISTHLHERDFLWFNMLNGISDSEKVDAFGSTDRYLLAMCKRMNQLESMTETNRYLNNELKKANTDVKALEKNCKKIYYYGEKEKFINLFTNAAKYLRENGVKSTFNRILKELKHNA